MFPRFYPVDHLDHFDHFFLHIFDYNFDRFFLIFHRKKALRALNERLTQMQQKSSQQEMESIDGWPLLENESTPSSTPSASVSEINNKESNENEADSDSDKNSQESFVKVPKGTDSDPLSD